jgi:hypothetical protein
MLDIYFLSLVVAGSYFFLKWRIVKNNFNLYIAGVLLMLSTGFHYQAWVIVNSLNLLSLILFFSLFVFWDQGK